MRVLAYVPGIITLIATMFTDFAPLNPRATAFLFWTPGEIGVWAPLIGGGALWGVRQSLRESRARLRAVSDAEELRRIISAIGVAASWDLDLSRLYQRISQDLRSIIDFDRFTVTVAQANGRMRVQFVRGEPGRGLPTGSLLPVNPREPDGLDPKFSGEYRSRMTVPVAACNGTLTLRHHEPGFYTAQDMDVLRQVVAQISPGIANAMLFRATERTVRERTTLSEIGRAVTSEMEPSAILASVDESLSQLIKYDNLGVVLTDDTGATGTVVYWSNTCLGQRSVGDRIRFDLSEVSLTEVVRDDGSDAVAARIIERGDDTGSRIWLQAPLVVQDKLIGLLLMSSASEEAFDHEESALALNVSLQIAPAIQNANLNASLKRVASEQRVIAAIGLAANQDLN
ncbi:MAG: hypothetical protein O2788_01115, partial [Chloroflexi bacterium]|nr:hypothetical protein [Chloroflexota bacterium]